MRDLGSIHALRLATTVGVAWAAVLLAGTEREKAYAKL